METDDNDNKTSRDLSDYVVKTLDDNSITYERMDDINFKMELQGTPVDVDILVQCHDEKDCICVFAVPRYKIPTDKINTVFREINRLNIENPGQCLRVDEEDGIISAVHLINTEGGLSEQRILMTSVYQCYCMVNENIKLLLECIYGKEKIDYELFRQINNNAKYN
jgi:hypothetical protein